MLLQFPRQAGAGDVLHHHPVISLGVGPQIKDRQQVGVLQVQALPNPPQFHLGVPLQQLEGDLFPGVGQSVIHLSEATAVDGPLNSQPREGRSVGGKGEFHEAKSRRKDH